MPASKEKRYPIYPLENLYPEEELFPGYYSVYVTTGSNHYPKWWDTTITVYNRYEDPLTQLITWYHTTLGNCFWKDVGNKISINDVVLESNGIICRIPKNDNFLEKYEWMDVPNDEMSEYFTLGQGDIIVRGVVTDNIDEYQSGYRSSDFLKKYKALQGCMQIEKVGNNTGVGRGLEHYFVQGI